MLGWSIGVYRQLPETSAKIQLASWRSGINGLDWIRHLVEAGQAASLGFNGGYPCRFSVTASAALPILTPDPLPHDSPITAHHPGTPGIWGLLMDRDEIARCSPDEQLLIEAWDQS